MMKLSDCALSREVRELVAAELRGGEELQWAGTYGKPPRSVVSTVALVNLIIVALATVQVIWLWPGMVAWLCIIIGGTFPVISFLQLRAYRSTICMLSNHRVAWLRGRKKPVRSLPLSENMIRRVVMKQGGSGDIVFATAEDNESCVFYNVPQVKKLISLITELSAGR